MSFNRNKYEKARRRLAAVTFLSNISLDGSFMSTELRQTAEKKSLKSDKCDCVMKTTEIQSFNHKDISRSSVRNKIKPQTSPVHRISGDNHSLSSDSEPATATPVKGLSNNSFRERSSGNNDFVKDRHSSVRARKAVAISQDDKSSSESLNFGRFRTSSTCILENASYSKEVRFVKSAKGVSFKDERLAFVPGQGVPCVLFSTIPYSKTVKTTRSDIRKDGVRRRNPSGPRPLSAITDNGIDPFDLMGLEKEEHGQDISYSKLLVPARICTREQYKKMYEGDFADKATWKIMNRHPHVIARTKLLTRHKDRKW